MLLPTKRIEAHRFDLTLRHLCVRCLSVVSVFQTLFTAASRRPLRWRRERVQVSSLIRKTFLKSQIVFAATLVLSVGSLRAKAQTNTSVYTTLEAQQCRTLKWDGSGSLYLGRCPGVGGYSLLVAEDDLRQDITVVTPHGARRSLDLWEVVTSGFSRVGSKAEWRMAKRNGKIVPLALIVRCIANEDSTQPSKTVSYLVVSKITAETICVTDKISAGTSANEEARRAADVSGTKPCLKK